MTISTKRDGACFIVVHCPICKKLSKPLPVSLTLTLELKVILRISIQITFSGLINMKGIIRDVFLNYLLTK